MSRGSDLISEIESILIITDSVIESSFCTKNCEKRCVFVFFERIWADGSPLASTRFQKDKVQLRGLLGP